MKKTAIYNKLKSKISEPSFLKKEKAMAIKEIKVVGKKIVSKLKKAKNQFDSLDGAKKKRILTGIIAAGTIAAGIGAIAIKNHKKK